ncbi:hypothetical protein MSAN_01502000 [Mycena sanguinolenta]|uniref:Uncharacterized protein n=1 Tax=Mycena sanguinolenta TaxID=230812 RepID=A0A8H6Y2Z0_9AGAR|nr:hypothetical protein MSAN_01502000 [Mycena sanguinolenta]
MSLITILLPKQHQFSHLHFHPPDRAIAGCGCAPRVFYFLLLSGDDSLVPLCEVLRSPPLCAVLCPEWPSRSLRTQNRRKSNSSHSSNATRHYTNLPAPHRRPPRYKGLGFGLPLPDDAAAPDLVLPPTSSPLVRRITSEFAACFWVARVFFFEGTVLSSSSELFVRLFASFFFRTIRPFISEHARLPTLRPPPPTATSPMPLALASLPLPSMQPLPTTPTSPSPVAARSFRTSSQYLSSTLWPDGTVARSPPRRDR